MSDEGGGIPRSGLPRIWTYLYTTAQSPVELQGDQEADAGPAVLAGYGYVCMCGILGMCVFVYVLRGVGVVRVLYHVCVVYVCNVCVRTVLFHHHHHPTIITITPSPPHHHPITTPSRTGMGCPSLACTHDILVVICKSSVWRGMVLMPTCT